MSSNVRYLGGFTTPRHGSVLGYDVTAAFGWGIYSGEVLYTAGHVETKEFAVHHERACATKAPPPSPSELATGTPFG